MKTVLIPTLNEGANIGRLIPLIFEHLEESETSVIVIDEDSRDNTQEIVKELSDTYNVKLLVRKNSSGISSAVRHGAENAGNGYVAVMDADFSHHPRDLGPMFKKLDEGYDIVIGSRYVDGGRMTGWPIYRTILSLGATAIAKTLLRVPVSDPMSGFAAFRSNRIILDHMCESYIHQPYTKFLIEILGSGTFRVAEIPIEFKNRQRGESKLTPATALLYLDQVFRQIVARNGHSMDNHVDRVPAQDWD
ncbi:MAG: polyprenol monophosphomannose synthase [Candidatus Hodarchaeota archaeon]